MVVYCPSPSYSIHFQTYNFVGDLGISRYFLRKPWENWIQTSFLNPSPNSRKAPCQFFEGNSGINCLDNFTIATHCLACLDLLFNNYIYVYQQRLLSTVFINKLQPSAVWGEPIFPNVSHSDEVTRKRRRHIDRSIIP